MSVSPTWQLVAWFLALAEFFMAVYVLLLSFRHPANRHVSGMLWLIANSNVGLGLLLSARDVTQGVFPTLLLSVVSPALSVMLLLTTVVLLKPSWLQGRWRWGWWLVYALIFLPGVLTLIDLIFGTRLWYTGLDIETYRGGFVSMSHYVAGRWAVPLKALTLSIVPLAGFVPLLYVTLVDKKAMRLTRWLAWLLLGVQVVVVGIEVGLRKLLPGGVSSLLSSTVFVFAYGYAASRQVFPEQRLRLRLVWKVLIPLIVGAVVVVGVLVGLSVNAQGALLEAQNDAELHDHYTLFMTMLGEHAERMVALSASIANLPDVQRAFAGQDRDELARLLSPSFQALRTEGVVSLIALHLPPAIPFFHLIKPEIEGRDVSRIRPMLVEANAGQKPLAGLDPGKLGLPIRGTAPVFDQDRYIGLVESTVMLDDDFLKHVKERIDNDLTIYVSTDVAVRMDESGLGTDAPEGFLVYASTTQTRLPIDASFYRQALEGQERVVTTVFDREHRYTVMLSALVDYAGHPIAIIEFVVSRDALLRSIARNRNTSLLLGAVVALALSLWTWFYFFRLVVRPMSEVQQGADRVGRGDLSYRLELETGDEIEKLVGAFNQMTDRLRDSMAELAQRAQDLEQRAAYLEASAAVGQAATSILEAEELERQVVQLIQSRFNLYYVGLFLLDEAEEWAVLRVGTGEAGREMLARGHRLKVGEGMIGWCIAHQQARIALDVGTDAVRFNNPLLPETRSEGALPLRSRGRVLGALTVQSSEAAAFDQDTVRVLQVMADQVAVALDNAKLFARSQAALEAERRAYGEISREAWLEKLGSTRSGIGYRADERGVRGLDDKRVGSGLPELVLPVRVRGNVIGTVIAHKSDEDGGWTVEERELVETLIDNLDVALESARLYEDTQRREARERLRREIADHVRAATSVDDAIERAVQSLKGVFDAQVVARVGIEQSVLGGSSGEGSGDE